MNRPVPYLRVPATIGTIDFIAWARQIKQDHEHATPGGRNLKIAWITDSASCIDLAFARENNIHVVPLNVIFDGQSYKDMIEMDEHEFYRLIAAGKTPTTSQPSVGDFAKVYTQLKTEGYEAAIAVHVSSQLSGTLNASHIAAEMVDFPVHIIDSGIVAKPMLFALEEGLRLYQAEKHIDEIVAGIKATLERVVAYFMINDLSFLHRGGRLSATSAIIGNLLQIKPILLLRQQKLEIFEKVRTTHRAKEFLYNLLEKDVAEKGVKEINVVHADHFTEAENWAEQLKEKFRDIHVAISSLGTVVGVHSGPRAIGLTWRI